LTIFTTDLLYWIISLRLALRDELLGGLVSVSLAIPLAMGYGMLLSTLSVTAILPMVRLPASTLEHGRLVARRGWVSTAKT
jgi:MFS superfamily sulfate permease-like transporter